MALQLATPIIPPRTIGVDISRPTDDQEAGVMSFIATAVGPGQTPLSTHHVVVRDGKCQGLRAGVAGLDPFTLAVPTGYAGLTAAIGAVAGPAARKAAALTWMAGAGILPPGTTT